MSSGGQYLYNEIRELFPNTAFIQIPNTEARLFYVCEMSQIHISDTFYFYFYNNYFPTSENFLY
jgi:hypothetical protein